jgi:protoporphyrinogen/coproporphyrinogen III oxidase
MKRVVIVGGGITGLAAAYRLEQHPGGLAITLVEAENRLGGKILTERFEGFIVEGGPDCFLSRKPRGTGLCEELGVTGRLQGRNEHRRATYVVRDGALHPLPEGLSGMIPTDLDALESSTLLTEEGRARLKQEPALPPRAGSGDESVASFASRRLGTEAYERLVEPLLSGIYAGDGAQLSLAATFPQLRRLELEHGSLIGGLLATAANGGSSPATQPYPPFVSFRSGMGELVETLVQRLRRTTILTGSRVTSVARDGATGGYSLLLDGDRRIQADALLLATPAYVTASLVNDLDPELAAAHRAIPYASTATVSLAYREDELPAPLDGFGYLVPRAEGRDVLACTWSSTKWEGRAPGGYALIRVYLGRYGGADILREPDDHLLDLALDEVRRTMGIEATPIFQRLYRWPRSMPQYTIGHLERLARIESRLAKNPGLFLAGAAYRGVGIPDCILSGEYAAEAAMSYLRPR